MVDSDEGDLYLTKPYSPIAEDKNEVVDKLLNTTQEEMQNLYLENTSNKTTSSTDTSTPSINFSPRRQNIFKEIYLANKRRFSLPGKHLHIKEFHNTAENLSNTSVNKTIVASNSKTGSIDNLPASSDSGATTFLEHHQPPPHNSNSKNFLRRYSLTYIMNGNFHRSDGADSINSHHNSTGKSIPSNGRQGRRVSVIEIESNSKRDKEKFHYAGLKLKDKQKLQSGYIKIHVSLSK
uniref:Cnn_1N domain-containing protein n=1 Tax=Parastrongyloides trichosuri TaxID=131310 RepID=A0A0N4Z031_PARTI